MKTEKLINQMISLARGLGNPNRDYVILGEGNISGKSDDETFWVKASGTSLGSLTEEDLVQVYFKSINNFLLETSLSDDAIRKGLQEAKVDRTKTVMPSVETFLHAVLLQLADINFIGHTHPTAVNSILCSVNAEEAYSGLLFPDQIVYCGPAPLFVPYTDPGLPLAKTIQQELQTYIEKWNAPPKIILMENHGFIALGKTAAEVEQITAMGVKVANVILGTYTMGGPHFFSQNNVDRIYTRPDEKYRKEVSESK